jgi:tetratricopeptide (TPR) repeat protein
MEGKNLPTRPIYFESMDPYYTKGWAPLYGFIDGREKFVESPIPELYDLENDFDELTNLAQEKELGGYRKRLGQIVKGLSSPEGIKAEERLDPETLEKLKSLGYVGSLSSPESRKEIFGPEDDVKVLLPYYKKAIEAMDLYQNGKVTEGIKLLNDIIEQRKDFYLAYYDLGIVYRDTRRLKDALAVLKLGLERLPSNYEIFHNYVSYLLDAAQYDEVIKMVSEKRLRAMEFDPGIWLNLGVAYSNKGDLENARVAYEKALSIDKKNPVIYNNLGWNYYYLTLKTKDRRTFQKCFESFKKALELDPDYASSYNGLGEAYRLADNLDGAIDCWEKALQLKPDFEEALYSLGLAHFDKGETAKALAYLNRYKERYSHLLTPEERKELDDLIQKCRQK